MLAEVAGADACVAEACAKLLQGLALLQVLLLEETGFTDGPVVVAGERAGGVAGGGHLLGQRFHPGLLRGQCGADLLQGARWVRKARTSLC